MNKTEKTKKPTKEKKESPSSSKALVPQEPQVVSTSVGEVGIEEFKEGIDSLLAKRDYFIKKLLPRLREKQDYFIIVGKKSLAKGGAEKLASIYQFTATFEKDTDTLDMLSDVKGLVSYVCNLHRGDMLIGQGRGAATLGEKNMSNDPNKTIKMAQKRAYVDAVIRTTGLSDIFTQDLEDMNPKDIGGSNSYSDNPYPQNKAPLKGPASVKQKEFLERLIKACHLEDSFAIEAKERTGKTLTEILDGPTGKDQASKWIDYLTKAKDKIVSGKKAEKKTSPKPAKKVQSKKGGKVEPPKKK